MRNYFRILNVFNLMSGLVINYEKSSIILWSEMDNKWCVQVAEGLD